MNEQEKRELAERIGKHLRAQRGKRGWTLDVLAGLSGTHASHLSLAERGLCLLTLPVLVSVARTLGVTVGSLVDHEPEAGQ